MLQDARIELLTKIEYFIGAFTSHGCKSSKAMPGCSFSGLNCILRRLLLLCSNYWRWFLEVVRKVF